MTGTGEELSFGVSNLACLRVDNMMAEYSSPSSCPLVCMAAQGLQGKCSVLWFICSPNGMVPCGSRVSRWRGAVVITLGASQNNVQCSLVTGDITSNSALVREICSPGPAAEPWALMSTAPQSSITAVVIIWAGESYLLQKHEVYRGG